MNDIHDIKPPMALGNGTPWLALPGGVLLLAVVGLAVWRLRRTAPERRATRRLRRALGRLEAEASGLDDRDFAYRLTELLRQALARCTGIAATTLTTEEILPLLSASPLLPHLAQAVADVLRRADPPRYAVSSPFIPTRGAGGQHAPQPPEASSSSRQADLDTVRALLRLQGRPWSA